MRECPANQWISDKTWAAIDKRATLRRQGHLTTRVARQMGCEIKSFLAADRKQRAANAASTVESHLSTGAVKEAWRALKGVVQIGGGLIPTGVPGDDGQADGQMGGVVCEGSPHGGASPV
jgi:hypothetical protein